MIRGRMPSIDTFAREFPIGTPVRYYPIVGYGELDEREAFETVIRSEPWLLGHGAPVVKIQGRAGGVLISHIQKTDNLPHLGLA